MEVMLWRSGIMRLTNVERVPLVLKCVRDEEEQMRKMYYFYEWKAKVCSVKRKVKGTGALLVIL